MIKEKLDSEHAEYDISDDLFDEITHRDEGLGSIQILIISRKSIQSFYGDPRNLELSQLRTN